MGGVELVGTLAQAERPLAELIGGEVELVHVAAEHVLAQPGATRRPGRRPGAVGEGEHLEALDRVGELAQPARPLAEHGRMGMLSHVPMWATDGQDRKGAVS